MPHSEVSKDGQNQPKSLQLALWQGPSHQISDGAHTHTYNECMKGWMDGWMDE